MGYWKTKVLPKIKKVFEKNGSKKAAAEACMSFDDSKEEINKEWEDKKSELQPKIVEIYEASSAEIKSLVKDPKEAGLKNHSTAVHKFIEELTKIEVPGSKAVFEASSKYGVALISGPVLFVLEKVSTVIVVDEKVEEKTEKPAAATEKADQQETSSSKEKDIELEKEQTKEDIIVEEKAQVAEAAAAVVAEPTEHTKVEEAAAEPPKA